MSRVIHTESPGKIRNRQMRTCAELLRHLSTKTAIDDEVKDMTAFLVQNLREIDQGIDDSAAVWEKRDYWMKAEQLRQRWAWVGLKADQLYTLIKDDAWQRLPEMMIALLPHFSDIKVTRFTRTPDEWAGAYKDLMRRSG